MRKNAQINLTARSSLSNFFDMHEEIRNLQTKIFSKGWSVLKKLTFQACYMIDSGQMKDAKTIMLLQYAKIKQLVE